ncbi:hypothetical protein B0H14DRAFT_3449138 [Mycena olivaceomarginata]|nr:hypothetical protein B0H14DRAFT_3449138 [Mycena olivaceomarginata]
MARERRLQMHVFLANPNHANSVASKGSPPRNTRSKIRGKPLLAVIKDDGRDSARLQLAAYQAGTRAALPETVVALTSAYASLCLFRAPSAYPNPNQTTGALPLRLPPSSAHFKLLAATLLFCYEKEANNVRNQVTTAQCIRVRLMNIPSSRHPYHTVRVQIDPSRFSTTAESPSARNKMEKTGRNAPPAPRRVPSQRPEIGDAAPSAVAAVATPLLMPAEALATYGNDLPRSRLQPPTIDLTSAPIVVYHSDIKTHNFLLGSTPRPSASGSSTSSTSVRSRPALHTPRLLCGPVRRPQLSSNSAAKYPSTFATRLVFCARYRVLRLLGTSLVDHALTAYETTPAGNFFFDPATQRA